MQKKNSKKKNLIAQGGITAIAALITGLCMVLKQIPLTNMVKDRGNSVYASCYGLFFVLWLLSAYVIPYAAASMMQVRIRHGQYRNAGKIVKVSLCYAMITGLLGTACMVVAGQYIAAQLLLEPLAGFAMLFAAPALLLCSFSGVLRGYFQGNGSNVPTAYSMIIETVVMLVAGFVGAKLMSDYGGKAGALLQNDQYKGAFGVAGFMIGISAGALFSLLFLLFLYLVSRSYFKNQAKQDVGRRTESITGCVSGFLLLILPVVLHGLFFRGYLFVDQIIFCKSMDGSLSVTDISSQWGIYYGKYKILTLIPFVLAVSMSCSLAAKVRTLQKREIYQHLRDHVSLVLHGVMVVVIPFSVMIGALAVPILRTFYHGQDPEFAAELLLPGCITSILFSAAFLMAEVLRGLKKTKIMLICGAVSLAIHFASLYLMLEVLHLDVSGALYADIIYAFALCVFMGAAVQKSCHMRYSLLVRQIPCMIAGDVMGVILFLLTKVFGNALQGVLLLTVLAVGFLIYWIILLLCKGATAEELQCLPGGRLIERVATLCRLM